MAAKSQQSKISQTLKKVGAWFVSDKLAGVTITNPFPELADNLNSALDGLEDKTKIINNPR